MNSEFHFARCKTDGEYYPVIRQEFNSNSRRAMYLREIILFDKLNL
jgi:hypothetical protein